MSEVLKSYNKVSRLFLAADYGAMFNRMLEEVSETSPEKEATMHRSVDNLIQWAKRIFKGNNAWIVWWLRWLRVSIEHEYNLPGFERDWSEMKKKNPDLTESDIPTGYGRMHQQNDLTHFMSLPDNVVGDFRPSYESIKSVIAELKDRENEWKAKSKGVALKPSKGDRILIDLGGGWAWWFLNRSSCSDEANAMGHCGNGGSTDDTERILSLRKETSNGQWTPHLTFILDERGYLGEMKGRGNSKPNPKYYPYIVKLLENPIIKGIKGGGFLSENNFNLNDLPEETREKLYKNQPNLMPVMEYYNKFGLDKTLTQRIIDYFYGRTYHNWNMDPIVRFSNTDYFFVAEAKDVLNLTSKWGNRNAYILTRWCLYRNIPLTTPLIEEQESLLEELRKERPYDFGEAVTTLMSKYKNYFKEWEAERDTEFNPDNVRNIIHFARYVNSGIINRINSAWEHGKRWAVYLEAKSYMTRLVKESEFFPLDAADWEHTPYRLVLHAEVLIDLMNDERDLASLSPERYFINADMSAINLDAYDQEVALKHFYINRGDV